jgi:hypothetical protein
METRQILKVCLTLGLFFMSFAMLNNAFGKHHRVTSSRGLADAITMNDLVVALFYVEGKGLVKEVKEKIHAVQRDFRTMSKTDVYEYVGILFASVNVAKEDMLDMVVRYGVVRPAADSPSFALFRGGKMVACLSGFRDREEMRETIEQYLGHDISRIEKEKDAQRQRRIEAARVRSAENAAAYPYWYWGGWPYYGGWYGYGAAWPYYGGGSWWGPSWRGWGGYHGGGHSYHGGGHGGGGRHH